MLHHLRVDLTGTTPLLMENGRSKDPLDPLQKEISSFDKLTVRQRTDEGIRATDKLRWLISVYQDADGHVILPRYNMFASCVHAGRIYKLGKHVASAFSIADDSKLSFPDEELTVSELVEMSQYTNRIGNKRGVMTTRPIFDPWSASYEVFIDDDLISFDDGLRVIHTAGKIGIGAWRALYGKFDAQVEEVTA